VPNRFEDGYGLSPEVVDQAHARGAQMIMTVDNGISSHAGVDRAHALGIPVLVTDHHLPGERCPMPKPSLTRTCASAIFRRNRWRVGVAFYLMLALRTFLRDKGWFDERGWRSEPGRTARFGGAWHRCGRRAAGCQQPHSHLAGLKPHSCREMPSGHQSAAEVANRDRKSWRPATWALPWPRLNAAGRLDDMSVGVALLLCDNSAKRVCWPTNLMR
jgi:single-stranded-DNA-specific exonuclease